MYRTVIVMISTMTLFETRQWQGMTDGEKALIKSNLALGSRAGLDLGLKRHPSHLCVLLEVVYHVHEPEREEALRQLGLDDGSIRRVYQLASVWFDNEPYTKQIEMLRSLFERFQVSLCLWDATRGELEALRERSALPDAMMYGGVVFTREVKAKLAANLNFAIEGGDLFLLNDERQKRSILSVNNALQSDESEVGHGDAFWSLALALEAYNRYPRHEGSRHVWGY